MSRAKKKASLGSTLKGADFSERNYTYLMRNPRGVDLSGVTGLTLDPSSRLACGDDKTVLDPFRSYLNAQPTGRARSSVCFRAKVDGSWLWCWC